MSQLFLCFLLCFHLACGTAPQQAFISITIESELEEGAEHVTLFWGTQQVMAGGIAKGGLAGLCCYNAPTQETVVIKWEDPEGKPQQQEVSLRGIYPPGATGELTFLFTKKGWQVSYCKSMDGCDEKGQPKDACCDEKKPQ